MTAHHPDLAPQVLYTTLRDDLLAQPPDWGDADAHYSPHPVVILPSTSGQTAPMQAEAVISDYYAWTTEGWRDRASSVARTQELLTDGIMPIAIGFWKPAYAAGTPLSTSYAVFTPDAIDFQIDTNFRTFVYGRGKVERILPEEWRPGEYFIVKSSRVYDGRVNDRSRHELLEEADEQLVLVYNALVHATERRE